MFRVDGAVELRERLANHVTFRAQGLTVRLTAERLPRVELGVSRNYNPYSARDRRGSMVSASHPRSAVRELRPGTLAPAGAAHRMANIRTHPEA